MSKERVCPQNHHSQHKVCEWCGYVFPLVVGDFLGPYEVAEQTSKGHVDHFYRVTYQQDSYFLHEYRDHFSSDYRETVDTRLAETDTKVFVKPFQTLTEAHEKNSILYHLYPYTAGAQTLDQAIRANGYLRGPMVFAVIDQLILSLQNYTKDNWVHNHLNSFSLYLTPEGPRVYHQFYSDQLHDKPVMSPQIALGFSPPEQIRSGFVFAETDRYSLAMILFHMLTGLSPVLWYPDVPQLKRYRYFLDKDVIRFYENLLEPASRFSWEELRDQWLLLKNKLPDNKKFAKEVTLFYSAVSSYESQNYAQAAEQLNVLYESSDLHNAHVARYLGKIYWTAEKQREGSLFYGEACRRESLGIFYYELAQYFYKDGAVERAMMSLRKAVKKIPYDANVYTLMAELLYHQKRYKDSQIWLSESLRIKPSSRANKLLNKIRVHLFPKNQIHSFTDSASFSYHKSENIPWQEAENILHLGEPTYLDSKTTLPFDIVIDEIVNKRENKGMKVNTYVAHDAKGQKVWVKEVPLNFSGRRRWQKESLLLSNIDHCNIPTMRHAFEHEDHAYLVYDYVPAVHVGKFIKQGNFLSAHDLQSLFYQILSALVYLEGRGVVHADVKPANILWDASEKKAWLIDFDISVDVSQKRKIYRSSGVTIDYAPPEQRYQHLVHPSTDIYSLCMTLLQLCSGLTPDHFYYHSSKVFQNMDMLIPFTSSFRKQLDQILQPDAHQRLEACNALKSALQQGGAEIFDTVKMNEMLPIRQAIQAVQQAKSPEKLTQSGKLLLALSHTYLTLFVLGDYFAQHKEHGWAKHYFRESILRNPQWLYGYFGIVRILIKEGDYKEALTLLKKTLEKAPESAHIHNLIGECYLVQQDFDNAILFFTRSLSYEPSDLEVIVRLAHIHTRLSHLEIARELCDKALAINILDARVYQILQMIAAAYGQLDKAAEYGLRALSIKPEKANYHYDYGVSLYRLNRYEEAVTYFEKSLSLDADLIDAFYFLGNCYLNLGQLERSKGYLKRVLESGKESDFVGRLIEIIDEKIAS